MSSIRRFLEGVRKFLNMNVVDRGHLVSGYCFKGSLSFGIGRVTKCRSV